MNRGKDKCDAMRNIRRQVAERYGLKYNPTECHHEGDCLGTCPVCDKELCDLQRQLDERGIKDIDLPKPTDSRIFESIDREQALQTDVLEGMPKPLDDRTEGMMPMDVYMKLRECYIAGVQFHDIENVLPELHVGMRLALVRDKNNKYDQNAVAVVSESDYDGDPESFDFDFIIGYIPRSENRDIARMLDDEEDMFAEITEINEHAHYSRMVKIMVYVAVDNDINKHEPSELLRAICFESSWRFGNFVEDLKTNGTVYFEWENEFHSVIKNFPIKGERVVFMWHLRNSLTMYLTKVIAVGSDCSLFIEKNIPKSSASCKSYILGNIAGPITVHDWAIEFLKKEPIGINTPDEYLSDEASTKLLEIFNDAAHII